MSEDKKFDEINEELKKAIMEGPTFGTNSTFQLQNFVIGAHSSSEKQYRQVLMEINQKRLALSTAKIRRTKNAARLSQLRKKLEKETDEDEKIIIDCDIQELLLGMDNEEKLILDAGREYAVMAAIYEKMPKCTAEEYELQEPVYWRNRLLLDAQIQIMERGSIEAGTAKSLHQMGINPIQAQAELKLVNQNETTKALEHFQKVIEAQTALASIEKGKK